MVSAISPHLHGGLCNHDFVATGTQSYMCPWVGISGTKALSREQLPEHEGRDSDPHCHHQCYPVCRELNFPIMFPAGSLAPVASGVCHISLCCWPSDHWNPWGERDFSAQPYKTLCCTRHPKMILVCFLVTPGGMRSHQWEIIGLKSGQRKQSLLSPKHLLERCLTAVGFPRKAI